MPDIPSATRDAEIPQGFSARTPSAPPSLLEATSSIQVRHIAPFSIALLNLFLFLQISEEEAHSRLKRLLLADPKKPLPPFSGPTSDGQALRCTPTATLPHAAALINPPVRPPREPSALACLHGIHLPRRPAQLRCRDDCAGCSKLHRALHCQL